MAAGLDVPKISLEAVAEQAFDAVEAGQIEVCSPTSGAGSSRRRCPGTMS
jgi:hypothetical protein